MNVYLKKRIITLLFLLLTGLFLFGFQYSGIESEQGKYTISIEFLANPVKEGMNDMRLTIYDSNSKKPVQRKLNLEVIPWMPTNVHEIAGVPVIRDNGNGKYLIENINFDTSGDWEVYIKLKNGSEEDSAVFNISVIGQ